ncbi:hypothetical protein [Parashewanella tropica]|uniref:hypothetical protein n=1 Tax=Parashewanella tropica TaxID=2547970 RepID=UPI00105A3E81|nr:hypothetical protein [Parashewanella tropica]
MSKIIVIILLLVIAFDVSAEVSDKMPTITELWLHGVIFGIPTYLLIAWRKKFLILGILLTCFFATSSYETLNDPHVGVAVINEQGTPYIFASYSASVIIALCSVLGLIKNRFESKSCT